MLVDHNYKLLFYYACIMYACSFFRKYGGACDVGKVINNSFSSEFIVVKYIPTWKFVKEISSFAIIFLYAIFQDNPYILLVETFSKQIII